MMKLTYKVLSLALLLSIVPAALQAMETKETKELAVVNPLDAQKQKIGGLATSLQQADLALANLTGQYDTAKSTALEAWGLDLAAKQKNYAALAEKIAQTTTQKNESAASIAEAVSDMEQHMVHTGEEYARKVAEVHSTHFQEDIEAHGLTRAGAHRVANLLTAHWEHKEAVHELQTQIDEEKCRTTDEVYGLEILLEMYQEQEGALAAEVETLNTRLEQLRESNQTDDKTLAGLLAQIAEKGTEIKSITAAHKAAQTELERMKKPGFFSNWFGGGNAADQGGEEGGDTATKDAE